MYSIFPNSPYISLGINNTDISLQQDNTYPKFLAQKVAVFTGIPSSAKNCGLMCASVSGVNFTVTDSGLVDFFAVNGSLPIAVSFHIVENILDKQVGILTLATNGRVSQPPVTLF